MKPDVLKRYNVRVILPILAHSRKEARALASSVWMTNIYWSASRAWTDGYLAGAKNEKGRHEDEEERKAKKKR